MCRSDIVVCRKATCNHGFRDQGIIKWSLGLDELCCWL
jgi:hypothetical protein